MLSFAYKDTFIKGRMGERRQLHTHNDLLHYIFAYHATCEFMHSPYAELQEYHFALLDEGPIL